MAEHAHIVRPGVGIVEGGQECAARRGILRYFVHSLEEIPLSHERRRFSHFILPCLASGDGATSHSDRPAARGDFPLSRQWYGYPTYGHPASALRTAARASECP